MKRVLCIAQQTALYFCLGLIVLLALAMMLLRFWLIPKASRYRHHLETQIGSLIGETVRIDRLSARLHGFHPELSVNGFHVLDSQGRATIRFALVRIDVDPFRTLLTGRPAFDRLEVVGAKLSIRRQQDGVIDIAGLHVRDLPPAWLMADGRRELLNCELDWQDLQENKPPLYLGQAQIRLVNNHGRHRLSADITLPPNLGQTFRLVLDAKGNFLQPKAWSGRLYLEGKRVDMAQLGRALSASDLVMKSGIANFSVWGNWAGTLDSVAGDIELTTPAFALHEAVGIENQLALASLEGQFRWQREDNGWRLDLDRFRPALTDAWPKTRIALAIARRADGTPSVVRAAASYLNLSDINTVLQALPLLNKETSDMLKGLGPRGILRNIRFYFAPEGSPGERAALCGTFDGLGSNPWQSFPGVSGLSGKLCGNDRTGRISVSAENGTVQLTALGLKKPFHLNKASADLAWRQTDTDWSISSHSLWIENADLTARGRFGVVLPKNRNASPFLDLRVQLGKMTVAAIRHYLPFALLPQTSRWLERALIGGQIRNAHLLFHGAIADFPFYDNEGVFESSFDVQSAELRYHPDWPALTQTDARVQFYGPRLEINSRKGRIGRGEIVEAHAEAKDLNHAPWIKLTGTIRATLPDTLDFLAHTPLRRVPARLGKHVSTAGDTDISLNLAIPLDPNLGSLDIEGKAEFKDAKFRVEDIGVEMRHINGPLRFTQTGLSAGAIRASVFDRPALIRIAQESAETDVEIKGRVDVSDLQEQFPGRLWRFARGVTDYRLALRIPRSLDTEKAPLALSLSSTLTGLALNLPTPIGKREKARKDLYLEAAIRTGSKIPLKLNYGQDVTAQLRFSEPDHGIKLEGGSVAAGRQLPLVSPEPGLTIAAHLHRLEAVEWQRLLPDTPDEWLPAALLRKLDLNVGTLYLGGEALGPLSVDIERENQHWQGHINSAYGKGSFKAAADSIAFDLEYLKLPKLKASKGEPTSTGAIDPSAVPSLDLNAKRLFWQGTDLGPLTLRTERHAHGMIIKTLKGETRNHRFDIHGSWTRSQDQSVSTRLEGKLRIEDLGDLLAVIGYRGEIRDTPSDVDFALSWPGGPQQFSRANVTGDIRMKLGKGAILNVEPGLGRVLGMLSLDTLWRRLSFDFSDLFGKGLAYDRVQGTFQLGGGQAVTKGFLIDAVPAKIVINGRAGLVARDLDQIVTVIPHASVALPIAGALAGGPAVGAAVLLAQQLVGEEVDSITATHYAVKGSWDEPEITQISRSLPLDILDRAWSGVKDLSGFGNETETNTNE